MEIVIILLTTIILILGFTLYTVCSEINKLNNDLIIAQNSLFEIEHIAQEHNEIKNIWKDAEKEYKLKYSNKHQQPKTKSFVRPSQYCDCPFIKTLSME